MMVLSGSSVENFTYNKIEKRFCSILLYIYYPILRGNDGNIQSIVHISAVGDIS